MIPIGGIALWSGTIVDIPAGWQLCDGTNGTPDLRNKFLVCAGDTYAVDETGGAVEHNHDFTSDIHAHGFNDGGHFHPAKDTNACAGSGPDTVWSGDGANAFTDNAESFGTTGNETVSGTTDNKDNLPPFYSLAYIQRML